MIPEETILQVRELCVEFGPTAVVDGVSFAVSAGEVVGLVGESGCGKTTVALAILGLLPAGGRVAHGSVAFRGRQLVELSEHEWRAVRGAGISLVWQEPALALNPVLRAGDQVADVIRAHRSWTWRRCREEARRILAEVCPEETDRIARAYPHQLSGGQRQRVAIAQALACDPALLIADEATTALDAGTRADVLALLRSLKERRGLAMLVITHDPMTLVGLADRILVMYGGQIVEEGDCPRVLEDPLHPYTRALLGCLAEFAPAGSRRLPAIDGMPPDPAHLPPGCRFEPRCGARGATCAAACPPLRNREPDRLVRCFRHER